MPTDGDASLTPVERKDTDWMRTYTTDAATLSLRTHLLREANNLPKLETLEGELDYNKACAIIQDRFKNGDDQVKSGLVNNIIAIINTTNPNRERIVDLFNLFDPTCNF